MFPVTEERIEKLESHKRKLEEMLERSAKENEELTECSKWETKKQVLQQFVAARDRRRIKEKIKEVKSTANLF